MNKLTPLAMVFVLSAAGLGLVGSPAAAAPPTRHTPRNGMIAFEKFVPGTGHSQIFTMNPDGSHVRQLTFTRDADNNHPIWSSDGSKIVFERPAEIIVMNADGSGAHAVFTGCCGGVPAWSPDDKEIAFEHYDPALAISGIAIIDADGGHLRQITREPVPGPSDTKPHWSPDGKKFVYSKVRNEPESAVFTIDVDGTHRHQLTPWAMDATSPGWSPDGARILFNVYCCFFPGIVANVFTMRSDGSGLDQLTRNRNPGSGSFDASWSPDGRRIAFAHFPGAPHHQGYADIYTMKSDGTDVVNITRSPWNSATGANGEQAPWWGTHPPVG